MATNKLTDAELRRAIANWRMQGQPRKIFDGEGLYLHVNPRVTRTTSWRLKFRLDGHERTYTLGPYPRITLAEARRLRDEARKLIDKGINPVEHRREQRQSRSDAREHVFSGVAKDYFAHNSPAWSETHRRDVLRMIAELNATLHRKPIAGISKSDVQRVIDAAVKRGAVSYAHDLRLYYRQILRHFNRREHPIADVSQYVVVPKVPPVQHHATLKASEIPAFLRALANSDAGPMVRIATKLLLLTALRTTELRLATWDEIDAKARLWRIPAERMKARRGHLVPLSSQTLELLSDLRRITGGADLLFPHLIEPQRAMSDGTILAALRRMGYAGRLTGHGFRAMFSTWANEQGYRADAIERQLAHVPRDAVRAAYNAAEHLPERRRMMQAWADFLAGRS